MVKVVHSLGRVRVHTWAQVVDHNDVKIFEIDLESKYPGPVTVAQDSEKISVMILVGENTLDTNPNLNDVTYLDFYLSNAHDWKVLTDGSRYTVRVVMYR